MLVASDLPAQEVEIFRRDLLARPEYFDPSYVASIYGPTSKELITDPFSIDIIERVRTALKAGQPLSVIRLGDGEINLLSYGAYPETPVLNDSVVSESVARHPDSFAVTAAWRLVLRDLMLHALAQADIVGLLGIWRPRFRATLAQEVADMFEDDPRGISGQWRGLDLMLRYARNGRLADKIVAPAHLYFSVLRHLDRLLDGVRNVACITNRLSVVEALRARYTECRFMHIAVAKHPRGALSGANGPDFLAEVESALPADMSGTLSLVGAGMWAEVYCTWIKGKGGVAVDIGSAYDIFAGRSTRPIHGVFTAEELRRMSIVPTGG